MNTVAKAEKVLEFLGAPRASVKPVARFDLTYWEVEALASGDFEMIEDYEQHFGPGRHVLRTVAEKISRFLPSCKTPAPGGPFVATLEGGKDFVGYTLTFYNQPSPTQDTHEKSPTQSKASTRQEEINSQSEAGYHRQ